MSDSTNQNSNAGKHGMTNKPRPEVRDDLDSRKNEEQEFKGDDVTHNTKETKEDKLKDKSED